MNDHIYYLYVNGEIEPDIMFSTEQEAVDFAEREAIKDYQVVEWDVD